MDSAAIARWLLEGWPAVVSAAHVAGATAVTVHAVTGRRDVPAVVGWVGLAWLAPGVGSVLYLLLGINRIRRASLRRRGRSLAPAPRTEELMRPVGSITPQVAEAVRSLEGLDRLVSRVTGRPLLAGNAVTPLPDGDVAYAEMLSAIDRATASVTLLTYIFDSDRAGDAFRSALATAQRRGVQVRVLIDAVGARYSRPSMVARLQQDGIPVATFLPARVPWRFPYANLRNHRKLLVVDGRVGFTGGMNIREGHQPSLQPANPVRCLHFRLEGPIVRDLQQVFADDWHFARGEFLPESCPWYAVLDAVGPVAARGVSDGPDAELGSMPTVLFGAITSATTRIAIMSPYFLPDERLRAALTVASLRGVRVDLLLPGRSNVPLMDWAMVPQMTELLESGCRIWRSPPPFDHTKLFVVDGCWSLIGSTNWDPRSLRLNFEYNVECYCPRLGRDLEQLVDARLAVAVPERLDALRRRPLPIKVRDGLARLFTPYL